MRAPLPVFSFFTKKLAEVPARAVVKALDLECKTLQDDLNRRRAILTLDSFSILYFGQFVNLARRGKAMCTVEAFPPDHIEFYKETIVRLVQAKQLPPAAVIDFDQAFTIGL